MNATIVFPTHFEVRSARGNLLPMKRLFRFRCFDNDTQQMEDFVVARQENVYRDENLIDVFRIDPVTGAPLWVSFENEGVYSTVSDLFPRWKEAAKYLDDYRARLYKKYKDKILPYLEYLEDDLLRLDNAAEVAEKLACRFDEKKALLDDLRKALCNANKSLPEVQTAADTLVYTLWGEIHGLEAAKALLKEVKESASLLDSLAILIEKEVRQNPDAHRRVRGFLLDTYVAQPCRLEAIDRAMEDFFNKRKLLRRLEEQLSRDPSGKSFTLKDIQALYLTEDWLAARDAYNSEF